MAATVWVTSMSSWAESTLHLGQCHFPPFCLPQGPPALRRGGRGVDGDQVGKVQGPETLAQELAASLNRCVSRPWAGGWMGGAGGIRENPWGHCVQWRVGCTSVYRCVHMALREVGRIGYGHKLLSPHPCTRALGLREQLRSLREELEHVAQKGRARCAQSAELNRDLCKAHRWVPLFW